MTLVLSRIFTYLLNEPMTLISFLLVMHLPVHLNRTFPYERLKRLSDGATLLDRYFDEESSKRTFLELLKKQYYPIFSTILEIINSTKGLPYPFKIALSINGLTLERLVNDDPHLLELIRKVVKTGCVEVLGGPYYHSLAGIYPTGIEEFKEQVEENQQLLKRVFNFEPKTFLNTEMVYNDIIAKTVQKMGFESIVSEGERSLLEWRSPTHLYTPLGADSPKILLRHPGLSDDLSSRFSKKDWDQYPLTPQKYADWLASTPGDYILIAEKIECLGGPSNFGSEILDFIKSLPIETSRRGLEWKLPTEIAKEVPVSGSLTVPSVKTISWCGEQKDTTVWLENSMQRISFHRLAALRDYVKEINESSVTKIWRILQQSDHLLYMSTRIGEDSIFNSYSSPIEAFSVFNSILTDYEGKVGTIINSMRKKKAPQQTPQQTLQQTLTKPATKPQPPPISTSPPTVSESSFRPAKRRPIRRRFSA